MVLSPSQRPPYPLRSDRCTAPCTRRSSAGHGTHVERHCRSADHQDLPSMHQIPPRHPPRTSVIRHSLESDESEPRNRKFTVKLIRNATPLAVLRVFVGKFPAPPYQAPDFGRGI